MSTTARTPVLLAFASIYLIWGSTYLAIRIALESLPPFLFAGARFLTAGALLYAWMRWRGTPRPSAIEWRSALIVGTLLMFGGNGLVTLAQQRVESGVAAVLVSLMPLWMAVFHALLFAGPRPTTRACIGLACGVAGVAWLMAPSAGQVAAVDRTGALMVVLASMLWALGSLSARQLPLPRSSSLAVAMEMTTGGIVLLAAGGASGEWSRLDLTRLSSGSLFAWLYLVLFGSIVALCAYQWLLGVVSPAAVSTYAFVNPVVAVVLGWAIGGEAITGNTLVASALIVGGVVLLLLRPRASILAAREVPALERPAGAACDA